jgi:hypothetical protein
MKLFSGVKYLLPFLTRSLVFVSCVVLLWSGVNQASRGSDGECATSMRLSWNEGYMEFDGVRLSEVVDQFNLNNRVQIVIVDPALAGLRISGRFNAGDAYGFATTLHRGFGIRVRVVKDRAGHEELVFGRGGRKVADARIGRF